MGHASERDFKLERLEHTLRVYRVALALCLVLLIVLGATLLAGRRHRVARAISVDGQVVCLVPNQAAAEQVRRQLLAPLEREWGVTPVFLERWDHQDAVANGKEVLTLREAVEALEGRLTPLVPATAIVVEGRQAVVLADRDTAQKAIETVKARFLGEGEKLLEQKWGNAVQFAEVQVPPGEIMTDLGQVASLLVEGQERTREYMVREGDTIEQIARVVGLEATQLLSRVSALRQGAQPGMEVKVKYRVPAAKLISIKEVVVETEYRLPPEEVATTALAPGERRVASEGKPGKKRVTEKRVYENDKLVSREPLKGVVIEEATPGRVMVGQRPPTSSED